MSRYNRPVAEALLAGVVVAMLGLAAPLSAQEANAPTAAAEQGAPDEAASADGLEPDEIDALVAPVVLYPDPLLTLILQASISPLDVVEADRFLRRHEKDATLTPDADWDASVIGLLNYPDVVGQMSEYLDWTQLLGTAIVDQTDQVQASIQTLRLAAVDRGILVSNDAQKVVVTDGVVVIAPASKDTLSVPQYDPTALLAALTPVAEAPAPAPAPAPAEAAGTNVVVNVEQPPAAPAAPEPAPAAATAPPPAETAPAAVEAPAPVETAAPIATQAAPAPIYYGEPTYAAAPPPVTYAAPQSTFWSTAATFAGGAAIGGLLGYVWGDNNNDNDDGWDEVSDAIRDLDDDDWDNFVDHIDDNDFNRAVRNLEDRDWSDVRSGRDVNISDSTIVVGNDLRRNQLDAKLQNKRNAKGGAAGDRRTRVTTAGGGLQRGREPQPIGLAPARVKPERAPARQAATRPQTRDVKLPGSKQASLGTAASSRQAGLHNAGQSRQPVAQRTAAQSRQPAAQRAAGQPRPAKTSMASGIERPRDVQAASKRGAASKASSQRGSAPKAAANRGPRATAAASGGNRPMGGIKNGQTAKRDASRGKKSLGKSGGGPRRNQR